MTGQESYIFEEFRDESIRFYPIKRAMVIEGRNKEKKDIPSLFNKFEKLNEKVDEALESLYDG